MNVERSVNGLAYLLVLVGALNWGLVGAFDYNLVVRLFGDGTFTTVVYVAIGLAAIYLACGCCCKSCDSCTGDKK